MDSDKLERPLSSSTDNEDEGRLIIADQPPESKMINNNDLKVKLMWCERFSLKNNCTVEKKTLGFLHFDFCGFCFV